MSCWWTCFWKRTPRRRTRSCWIWTPRTWRCMESRRDASSTATTIITAICRCTSSAASTCCGCGCGEAISTQSAGSLREVQRIVGQIRAALAGGADHPARRFRFCREELMAWCEEQSGGLRLRVGAQSATAADHRAADARSRGAVSTRRTSRRGSSPSSATKRRPASWSRRRGA